VEMTWYTEKKRTAIRTARTTASNVSIRVIPALCRRVLEPPEIIRHRLLEELEEENDQHDRRTDAGEDENRDPETAAVLPGRERGYAAEGFRSR
jgi:hypothetical protein